MAKRIDAQSKKSALMATVQVSGDCTLPQLTGETAKAPNGEEIWSFRDAETAPLDDTLNTAHHGASGGANEISTEHKSTPTSVRSRRTTDGGRRKSLAMPSLTRNDLGSPLAV